MIEASFMYENQCLVVPFIVADTKGPNLLGRDVFAIITAYLGRIIKCLLCREKCKN